MAFDPHANPRPIMVLADTMDDNVPVISEQPSDEEYFGVGWEEATEEQYARYLAYWDAYYDADAAGLPLPDSKTFTVKAE